VIVLRLLRRGVYIKRSSAVPLLPFGHQGWAVLGLSLGGSCTPASSHNGWLQNVTSASYVIRRKLHQRKRALWVPTCMACRQICATGPAEMSQRSDRPQLVGNQQQHMCCIPLANTHPAAEEHSVTHITFYLVSRIRLISVYYITSPARQPGSPGATPVR
jgi:hypothetical protein